VPTISRRIRRERVTLRNDSLATENNVIYSSVQATVNSSRETARKRNAWRGDETVTTTATTTSKVRGVATAATAAATTSSKVRREDVRGPRTGPRVRPHLVPRAAKRRADTPSGASGRGRVLPASVLRRAYAEPTRRREYGAADGHVSGSRPEHAAGKKPLRKRDGDTRHVEMSIRAYVNARSNGTARERRGIS